MEQSPARMGTVRQGLLHLKAQDSPGTNVGFRTESPHVVAPQHAEHVTSLRSAAPLLAVLLFVLASIHIIPNKFSTASRFFSLVRSSAPCLASGNKRCFGPTAAWSAIKHTMAPKKADEIPEEVTILQIVHVFDTGLFALHVSMAAAQCTCGVSAQR